MKTFQFQYTDAGSFSRALTELRDKAGCAGPGQIFFSITWTNSAAHLLPGMSEQLSLFFPDAFWYGAESSGSIFSGALAYGVYVTCFVLESPGSHAEIAWVSEGETVSSPDALWALCREKTDLRAVELLPASNCLDSCRLDGSVPSVARDIVLFGGASVNYENPACPARVMAAGHGISDHAIVAVLYCGENIHISASYVLGWKGLGRRMPVSGCEGKTVRYIDGAPAFNIYEKYVGMTLEDTDAHLFPLMVEEDGVEFIRTPQAFLPDRSIRVVTGIPEGALARLAYGDKNAILSSVYDHLPGIAAFAPDTVRAYSCAGRRLFCGDQDISRETAPVQTIAPVSGFYTGGEILRVGDKLRVMNCTLVLVSFREGENPDEQRRETGAGCGAADDGTDPAAHTGPSVIAAEKDRSLISRLGFFIEQVTKEQEEERRQKEASLSSAVDSLSSGYELVLFVNERQDQVIRLKASPAFADVIDSMPATLSGVEKLYAFFRRVIHPADYEPFLAYTSHERIERYAAQGKGCTFNFRIIQGDKAPYYRIRITQAKASPGCFIIGLLNINDDYLLRKKLENDEKQLQYLAVIESFSREYDSISYLQLQDEKELEVPVLYRLSEKLTRLIPGWEKDQNYTDRMDLLRKHFVIPEDAEIFREKVCRQAILDALESNGIYFVNFRASFGASVQYYQLKYAPVRDADGHITAIISGLHSIDSEMRRELRRNEEITAIVEERTSQLTKANTVLSSISDAVLEVMADLVESRSAESGQHVRRVKGFSRILAERVMQACPQYGLTREMIDMITRASALHDIGKITIPDSVLLKPGRLTLEEFEEMKQHSVRGADIIARMSQIWDEQFITLARDICLYHHEKWDGRGYPRGLKGDEIPIAAQIVSIADIYDALTTERCYKHACSAAQAYAMITSGQCGAFSTQLLDCFTACREQFEDYALNPSSPQTAASRYMQQAGFVKPQHIRTRRLISENMPLVAEIAEHVPNGFFIYREEGDGQILFFNDQLVRMLGCTSREDFITYTGNTFRGIVYPEDYDRTQAAIYGQIATDKHDMDHVLYRVRHRDGFMRTWDDYGHLVRSDDLGPVFFVCVNDITDYTSAPVSADAPAAGILSGMQILLVDDDAFSRALNAELLSAEGAHITEAGSGEEALLLAARPRPFDLILMDVMMPGMNGMDAIRAIRARHPDITTFIIAFSADVHPDMQLQCLAAGADDFICKPLSIPVLSARIISCMKERSVAMARRLDSAMRLANTDALTGVRSVTAYTQKVGELESMIQSDVHPQFAVLMCDINSLKKENDTRGHDSGDRYIVNCCRIICTVFGNSPVYRIGGDEFAVILQDEDYRERYALVNRLRQSVSQAMVIPTPAEGKASLSAGLAEYDPNKDRTVGDVVKRADEAMYHNKGYMKQS